MGRASTSRPAGYRPLDRRQRNHCVQVQWLFALAPMSVTLTLPLRWLYLLGIIRLHHPLVLTFTLNWTTPLIWRDTYYHPSSSGNSITRAVIFTRSRISCVIATLWSRAFNHLLLAFNRKWSRHLTDFPTARFQTPDCRRSAALCWQISTAIYVWLMWQLRQHWLTRGQGHSLCGVLRSLLILLLIVPDLDIRF